MKRFEIFIDNYMIINEWNQRDDITSTMEINKFANLTQEEFGKMYANSYRMTSQQ